MQIIELLSDKNKDYYLSELKECQWWAAKYLYNWIVEEKMEEMAQKEKKRTKIYMIISIVLVSSCFLFVTICLFINTDIYFPIYAFFQLLCFLITYCMLFGQGDVN